MTDGGKAMLYGLAAQSAWKIGSNSVANAYAEKATKADPNARNYFLLSQIQADLGRENFLNNRADDALMYFSRAIDAVESGQAAKGFQKESLSPQAVAMLYGMASASANRCGSNDLALSFAEKAGRSLGGTNTASSHSK
jgi:hypothetical protein